MRTEAAGTCVRSGLSRVPSGRGAGQGGAYLGEGSSAPHLLCPQNMRRRYSCRVVRLARSDLAAVATIVSHCAMWYAWRAPG